MRNKCELCGKFRTSNELGLDCEGRMVCGYCLDEYYVECPICGRWIDAKDTVELFTCAGHQGLICLDCDIYSFDDLVKMGKLSQNGKIRK